MPTYTYACKQCDDRFEVVRSFSDDPLRVCEECGGDLRQVFKPAGIVFKGSGWHIKDYADAKPGAGNGSRESSTEGGSSSDASSSSSSAGDASAASGSSSSSSSTASKTTSSPATSSGE